jgi:outer membrane protein assembly factor BamE (lipoprotein component of BamABCDE complex)
MKPSNWILSAVMASLLLTGCMSARDHADAVRDDGDKVTVGNVQREIRVGMSGAEVVAVLGSPNVVTTDADRNEVWVYDKIATEARYSRSSGGLAALLLGGVLVGDGLFGGAGGGSTNYASGASSTSQRTLTVVIYYDEAARVRDFAYHASSF